MITAWRLLKRLGWWLYVRRPIQCHFSGPVYDFVYIVVLDRPWAYWAFYVSRDRTGLDHGGWPMIFRDNG